MRSLYMKAVLFAVIESAASAAVRMPAVFSDHMVLQQQMPLTVWGWAEPGEKVEVAFRAQRVSATTEPNGQWRVWLSPEPAGGPFELTITGASSSTRFTDVLVGEVWLASGQSNMQWTVARAQDARVEIARATHPRIRLFSVARVTAAEPRDDVSPASWAVTSPETISEFSAVGYFFARALQASRAVPIGIIHSSWGGTPAEAWTSLQTLQQDPALQPLLWQFRRFEAEYPSGKYGFDQRQPIWNEAVAARKGSTPAPGMSAPRGAPDDPHRPAALFNAMIAPLTQYAIRGVIWYQGETNAVRSWDYQRLFTAMIQDWRRAWNRGDFPFLFVQLANFRPNPPTSGVTWWSHLREAQRLTLGLPNTAMASAIDIGNPNDIHPLNKQEVGRRLALAARDVAYGEAITSAGPLYDGMSLEGKRIRVRFRHTGKGLVLDTSKGTGFTIAGPDGRFLAADAVVDGNTIVVSCQDVPAPVAVRYAWEDDPITTLRNREGLPASPFRTNTW
jgi:sialate O-acetylesterase